MPTTKEFVIDVDVVVVNMAKNICNELFLYAILYARTHTGPFDCNFSHFGVSGMLFNSYNDKKKCFQILYTSDDKKSYTGKSIERKNHSFLDGDVTRGLFTQHNSNPIWKNRICHATSQTNN